MAGVPVVNEGQFTRRQLEWLEKTFKENLDLNASKEDLYRSQGARILVNKIRSIVETSEKKGVI